MRLLILFVSNYLIVVVFTQTTKVLNQNILSRRKRYLTFPKGSNFVITLSFSKALLRVQPTGWNAVGECDVPFGLPSDARLFKNFKRNHNIQKREVYSQLEDAFTKAGLNGNACLKTMFCESEQYIINSRDDSLIKQLINAVFGRTSEDNLEETYKDYCNEDSFEKCDWPVFNYILHNMSFI